MPTEKNTSKRIFSETDMSSGNFQSEKKQKTQDEKAVGKDKKLELTTEIKKYLKGILEMANYIRGKRNRHQISFESLLELVEEVGIPRLIFNKETELKTENYLRLASQAGFHKITVSLIGGLGMFRKWITNATTGEKFGTSEFINLNKYDPELPVLFLDLDDANHRLTIYDGGRNDQKYDFEEEARCTMTESQEKIIGMLSKLYNIVLWTSNPMGMEYAEIYDIKKYCSFITYGDKYKTKTPGNKATRKSAMLVDVLAEIVSMHPNCKIPSIAIYDDHYLGILGAIDTMISEDSGCYSKFKDCLAGCQILAFTCDYNRPPSDKEIQRLVQNFNTAKATNTAKSTDDAKVDETMVRILASASFPEKPNQSKIVKFLAKKYKCRANTAVYYREDAPGFCIQLEDLPK